MHWHCPCHHRNVLPMPSSWCCCSDLTADASKSKVTLYSTDVVSRVLFSAPLMYVVPGHKTAHMVPACAPDLSRWPISQTSAPRSMVPRPATWAVSSIHVRHRGQHLGAKICGAEPPRRVTSTSQFMAPSKGSKFGNCSYRGLNVKFLHKKG